MNELQKQALVNIARFYTPIALRAMSFELESSFADDLLAYGKAAISREDRDDSRDPDGENWNSALSAAISREADPDTLTRIVAEYGDIIAELGPMAGATFDRVKEIGATRRKAA